MTRELDRSPDGSVDVVEDGGVEYAVVGGERAEIAPMPPRPDGFTPSQRRKVSEAYLLIAEQLPTEGRDYSVSFSFPDPDGNPRLSFRGMTPLGTAFIQHLKTHLGRSSK